MLAIGDRKYVRTADIYIASIQDFQTTSPQEYFVGDPDVQNITN